MKKKLLLVIFAFAVLNGAAFAIDLRVGSFSDSTDTKLSYSFLSADWDISNVIQSYGITFNANLSGKNYGLESVVVRHVEYDDGTLGVRYAPLEDIRFGYGLLLDDLNTLDYQPAFLTNQQSGLKLDYDAGYFVLEGFGTYSHLYGFQVKSISLLNSNIGFEYISDAGNTNSEAFGSSAFGAFMELPITDMISLYGEAASSSNGGQGETAGLSFDYDLVFAFTTIRAGAVSFNNKFIPGYFTSGYDINPVDMTSLEAGDQTRYGTFASLGAGILGLVALNMTNENYTDGGSATSGSMLMTPLAALTVTGFVKELSFLDFRTIKGKDANMVGGSIEYLTKGGVTLSFNYKKTPFDEDLKPYETYYFQAGISY